MTSEPPSTASPADRSGLDEDVFCLGCGYNLRGLDGDRCPECGRTFDRATLSVSRIAWIYRGQIGTLRAYWRTVWLVTFRPRRFYDQIVKPVPYRSAQTFRWLTVLHVYLPFLLFTMAVYSFAGARPFGVGFVDDAFLRVWPVATVHVALILFLAAVTGVPSYFFHPRALPVDEQDRAVAMSYYSCAVLAWTPLLLLLIPLAWAPFGMFVAARGLSAGTLVDAFEGGPLALRAWTVALVSVGLGMTFLQPIGWWRRLVGLAARGMPKRRGRVVLLAVLLPVLWFLIAVFTLFGIPFATTYVALIFLSLG